MIKYIFSKSFLFSPFTFVCCLCLLVATWNAQAQSDESCFEADPNVWEEAWRSCNETTNPNPELDAGHWIQYDFGAVYRLSKSWVWNYNKADALTQGMQNVRVDHSLDGDEWVYLGDFEFAQGTGEAVYGGFAGPDFGLVDARYVLFTALSNWGDEGCTGLSEVKFNLEPQLLQFVPIEFACEAPTEVFAIDILSFEELILWQGEADMYVFRYRVIGEEEWMEIEVDDTEVFLEDLEPNTEYEFQIAALCITENEEGEEIEQLSDFGESYFFTTIEEQEECGYIQSMNFMQFDEEEIVVTWNEVVGSEGYTIRYRIYGEEEWTEEEVDDTWFELYGAWLVDDIIIEFQVESNCEEEGPTGFSESFYVALGDASLEDIEIVGIGDANVTNLDRPMADLQLYPNPAQDMTMALYSSREAGRVHVQILNLSGQLLESMPFTVTEGENRLPITLRDISMGLYILKVIDTDGKESVNKKIVVTGN